MAVISLPNGSNSVVWTIPERSAYKSQSEYAPDATIIDRGTYRRAFTATVQIAATSDDDVRLWRSFFMQASILSNTFLLPATKPDEQLAITPATVRARAGASAGATQLPTKDWARSGVETVMLDGQIISHAGRLHVLIGSPQSGDGGNNDRALLNILPPLRTASVEDAAINVRAPVGTMRMTSVQGGWEKLLSHYQPVSFQCEEAV